MKRQEKTFSLITLFILFLANVVAWNIIYDLNQPRVLEITLFDVGQGEAIFIQTPKRNQILIDGGPDSKILEKLSNVMKFWDRTIDLVVLTHPEKDHLTGLLEVLKKYKVENILWTGIKRDLSEYEEWKELIKNEKSKIYMAKYNEKIQVANLQIEIIYPFEDLTDKYFQDSNDTSIVSKLTFGNFSSLLTGDISKSVENKLIERNIDLKSDILKVSHHGSKNSSSPEFIEKVASQIALISVGGKKDIESPDCDNKVRNMYGHPNCEVLERLNSYGITIFRTDKEGDIKIISDGKQYGFSNF